MKLTVEQLEGLADVLPKGYRRVCDVIVMRRNTPAGGSGRRRKKRYNNGRFSQNYINYLMV